MEKDLIEKGGYVIILLMYATLTGIIKGEVIDENKVPLIGANVVIENTALGAATDENGEFTIYDVPVGTHTITASVIGYETAKVPYIVVSTTRPAYIEVRLRIQPMFVGSIKVVASYFLPKEEAVSGMEMSREEIRRTTGVAGDVSRMVQTMTGVSTPSDDRNDIVVRGGTPNENLYLIDGIWVPSLSHFSALGSAGGSIGLINADFLKKIRFYGGGFGPEYGNALSSVIDIQYKEGTKDRRYYLFDVSMAGAGLSLDGHIGKCRYLFSARRSFLDLLQFLGAEFPGVPQYYDIQGKFTYPITSSIENRNKLSFIFLEGKSWIELTDWEGMGEDSEIWNKFSERVAGITFKRVTGGYLLNSTLSYSRPVYVVEVESQDFNYTNNSFEEHLPLTIGLEIPNRFMDISTGGDFMFHSWEHWITEEDSTGLDTLINHNDTTFSAGYYIKFSKRFKNLLLSTGGRISYLDFTKDRSLSSMISISYDLTRKLTLNAGYGRYHQHPSFIWLTSHENNKALKDMESIHHIAGIEYLITEDTKISLEAYYKLYRDYPVDEEDSFRILLNEGASYEGYINFNPLVSQGKGEARGIDISIQKRFSHNFYGNVSYSYANTKLKPLNGEELKSVFVSPHSFKSLLGVELPRNFEIGCKFAWAEGRYYYPIDSLASANEGYTMRDYSRLEQYPDYHTLAIRISRREYYKKFTIEWYNEIDNVYNRKNIREHYWDDTNQEIKASYQWGFMFVGGLHIEF